MHCLDILVGRSILSHVRRKALVNYFHHTKEIAYPKGKQSARHSMWRLSLIDRQKLLVETTKPACPIMKMNFQNPMTFEPVTAWQAH